MPDFKVCPIELDYHDLPAYTYGQQGATAAVRDDMAAEARACANRIADHHLGMRKVARVRVEIEFGDGSMVAHEAKRTV